MPLTTGTDSAADRQRAVTPKIERVRPIQGHMLYVRFVGGEERIFSMLSLFPPLSEDPAWEETVFAPLRDPDAFADVTVIHNGGGVEWACGADLSRDTLYLRGAYLPPHG